MAKNPAGKIAHRVFLILADLFMGIYALREVKRWSFLLTPYPWTYFFMGLGIANWIFDSRISEFLIEETTTIGVGLTYVIIPPIIPFWIIAIIAHSLFVRKRYFQATVLRYCKREHSVQTATFVHLESTAVILALSLGALGMFSFTITDPAVALSFNVFSLFAPLVISVIARGMIGRSVIWESFRKHVMQSAVNLVRN